MHGHRAEGFTDLGVEVGIDVWGFEFFMYAFRVDYRV